MYADEVIHYIRAVCISQSVFKPKRHKDVSKDNGKAHNAKASHKARTLISLPHAPPGAGRRHAHARTHVHTCARASRKERPRQPPRKEIEKKKKRKKRGNRIT